MSVRPIAPIVVDDNGDVDVYQDVESACDALEAYDIDVFEAFDGGGRRLRPLAEGHQVVDLVVLDPDEETSSFLRDRLVAYMRRVGPDHFAPATYEAETLEVILELLLQDSGTAPTYERGLRMWFCGMLKMLRGR